MPQSKFGENDIFHSVIKAHPKYNIEMYHNVSYINGNVFADSSRAAPWLAAKAYISVAGDTDADDTIKITSADGTTITYTAAGSESLGDNEFKRDGTDAQVATSIKDCIEHGDGHNGEITVTQTTATAAVAYITVSGDPTLNDTIKIVSTDGTSRTYTAKDDENAASKQFDRDGTDAAVATSIKACIEHSNGHGSKITVTRSGATLTLTQATAGADGNNIIGASQQGTAALSIIGFINGSDETLTLTQATAGDVGNNEIILTSDVTALTISGFIGGANRTHSKNVSSGKLSIYEMNIDRPTASLDWAAGVEGNIAEDGQVLAPADVLDKDVGGLVRAEIYEGENNQNVYMTTFQNITSNKIYKEASKNAFTSSYPLTSSIISRELVIAAKDPDGETIEGCVIPNFYNQEVPTKKETVFKILALKNIYDSYRPLSPYFDFDKYLFLYGGVPVARYKTAAELAAKLEDGWGPGVGVNTIGNPLTESLPQSDYISMITIPKIFYGSGIKKGSVDLKFYYTGSLIGRAQDIHQNGLLVETTGAVAAAGSPGNIIGTILYNEGIMLITASYKMNPDKRDGYLSPPSSSQQEACLPRSQLFDSDHNLYSVKGCFPGGDGLKAGDGTAPFGRSVALYGPGNNPGAPGEPLGKRGHFSASWIDSPRWVHFGAYESFITASNDTVPFDGLTAADMPYPIGGKKYSSSSYAPASSSYSLEFRGTSYTPVLTMLAHAPKNDLNWSNNPTFIDKTNLRSPYKLNEFIEPYPKTFVKQSSSIGYKENDQITIKNTVSSSFAHHSESFKKQTFISKIGIYDDNGDLIAIAKLANPVRKTNEQDYTFKLKLDL
tara:strand:+ start:580 stop:3093 length:2514 start_codon:yes stop_codon:yes gene_type:complete